MSLHTLLSHASTPCVAVQVLEVEVHRGADGRLGLRYRLTGDLGRLRIPPQQPPARADKLWQHTCFEAFVAAEGIEGYAEFNFSPSTEWAAYGFTGYRAGMTPLDVGRAPRIVVERHSDRLMLQTELDLAALLGTRADLRLALSAVVEASDGGLSYWALRHPPGDPDFHHADGFTLRLAPGTCA